MRRAKRSIDWGVDRRPTTGPWTAPKSAAGRNSYFYDSPGYSFAYTWKQPVLRYQNGFPAEKQQHRAGLDKYRMASALPWLLSMSLLGVQEFAAQPGTDALTRDLGPATLRTPVVPSSGFRSSLRNYKALIASHEELPGHISCDSVDQENLVDRVPTTPEYNNHLYGSTPEAIDRFVPVNRRKPVIRPTERAIDTLKTDPRTINQLEAQGFNYGFGPARIEEDYVGPAMELVYAWSTIDLEYDSIEARDSAIYNGDFIPENNLPLGLEVWMDKVFITLPKWKDGVPVTLATVPRNSRTKSPKLRPYPGWEWHYGHCEGLTSVFRVQVDECDRLWVMDSGKVEIGKKPRAVCPPALFIFDLTTDTLLRRYVLPEEQTKEDSLYTNIIVDVRNKDCGSAIAYVSDVFRYGLVVYDFYKDSSFRIEHPYFYPDPLAASYDLHGVKFRWTDGLFGIALSPIDVHNDRTLFFHPMSSFREFAVSTSVLRDKRTAEMSADRFTPIGRPRAKDYGHSSGSVVDRNGVMFFNMVTRDSVWCWDTRKEYIPQNLGVIGTSNLSLVFPNDIRVDHDYEQNVWLLSNKLPMYLYDGVDSSKVNYRVFKANVKEAVKDTVCDPNYLVSDSEQLYDETC